MYCVIRSELKTLSLVGLHAIQGTRAAPIMKMLTIHDSVESERSIFSRTLEGQAITLPRAKAPKVAAAIIITISPYPRSSASALWETRGTRLTLG